MLSRREFIKSTIAAIGGLCMSPEKTKNTEFDDTDTTVSTDSQEDASVQQKITDTLSSDTRDAIAERVCEHRSRITHLLSPLYEHEENAERGKNIKDGIHYLSETIVHAWEALARENMPSRSGTAYKSHETVPLDIVAVLLVVEHFGYRDYQDAESAYARLRVLQAPLLVFAEDQEEAYKNETSHHDAVGIAQLREIGYRDACGATAEHPTCTHPLLSGNFSLDANSHHDAILAMLSLLDHAIAVIPREKRERLVSQSQNGHTPATHELGEYLAAVYNTGSGTTREAIRAQGEQWQDAIPGNYVDRFDAVWSTLHPQP
jgi:hypothetical protein